MDEKLEHFVALLHGHAAVDRLPGRARKPVFAGFRRLAAAGVALGLAGVAAVGLWFTIGETPRLFSPLRPMAHPVGGDILLGAAPLVTLAPPPAQAPPFSPPTAAATNPLGDEASLAPSTVTGAPPGPEPDVDLSVVPPPELAAPPPTAVEGPERARAPPWIRYAVAAPPFDGRPRVVVVIDDMGMDRKRSERMVALPGPLTLSYLPYAGDLARQTAAARRAGHELMVHVPMEPYGRVSSTGPNQLEVSLGREEVLRRLRWDLSRFDGYVGINNHMGSRFTSDEEALRPVIEELRARGLLFLDSRTAPRSHGVSLARAIGVPYAGRDVFLDDEIAAPAIEAQLAELERIARRNGIAIAIGHPHDQTIDVLERWLKTLPQKGLQLVPLSAAVHARAGVTG